MKELTNPTWIKVKALLFLALGLLSGWLVLADRLSLRVGVLLAITVWSFCRAYYFAFYVIEHYVDSAYRFSGLLSFWRYLWQQKRKQSLNFPSDHQAPSS
ncbi:MAG TPA: hypothetical protein VF532_13500 [Candidatus Angelobacter sp.]